jgi:hypothetical protein
MYDSVQLISEQFMFIFWYRESESSQKLQIPDECPKVLKEIMEKCWQIDPHDRPVSSHTLFVTLYFQHLSLFVCCLFKVQQVFSFTRFEDIWRNSFEAEKRRVICLYFSFFCLFVCLCQSVWKSSIKVYSKLFQVLDWKISKENEFKVHWNTRLFHTVWFWNFRSCF